MRKMLSLHRKRLVTMKPNEAINRVIALSVAPLLKEAGFRKHGRTWMRSQNGFDTLINIQASRWNNDSGASFVVNYGVHIPQLVDEYFNDGEVLSKQPSLDWLELISTRIVKRWGGQIWWDIYDDTDMEKLSRVLAAKIRDQPLAVFDSLQSLQDVARAVNRRKFDDIAPRAVDLLRDIILRESTGR